MVLPLFLFPVNIVSKPCDCWRQAEMVTVDPLTIRPNRHNVDIMEPPRYKPLRLIDDFKPSKTCKEYVEQDCAEALPVFRPYCKALVECSCEVSQPPRLQCPVLSLLPPPCLWDTSRSIN